ncbi:MAG: glycosyltransferase family 4 protein, partial [Kiritimatiellae bacterium]|nr:glycosyltransferase family 4 protein [Kiritimatiellia bacterium]
MNKPVYLYVTPFFPSPETWRGAYCFDFVKALKRLRPDLRVEVFVPGKGDDYEIDGIKVWRFPTHELPSNILPFLFHRHNEKSFLAALARAGVDLRNVKICHGHTANFLIYPLAAKRVNPQIKTLLHHHDPQSFGLNLGILRRCWLYNMYLFPVLRRLHEQIDTHVFISESVKRSFLQAPRTDGCVYDDYIKQMRFLPYRSVRIKDFVVLHNGVDDKLFAPKSHEKSEGTLTIGCIGNFAPLKDQPTILRAVGMVRAERERESCRRIIIGCVGNFGDWKSQETLIRAFKVIMSEHPDLQIKIRFVGSGEYLEPCKKLAADLGLLDNIEFLSEVGHEHLPDFYRSLDLFVLPSYFEGFGCVFTEAWSCGVPFITCEGQGMDDLIPA